MAHKSLESPDTSFLSLRNRLAHGGSPNNKEAKRLLNVWQDRFENCLKQLFWFQDIKMYVVLNLARFLNLLQIKIKI